MEELKNRVEQCTKCPLHKSRNKVVFGNGNYQASVFLIGEGPGYEEDKAGEAFVGRSGKLLDKILLACNFTREAHVFIGNIVKCRPPGNRTPYPEEMEACLPYLEEQIEKVDPAIIITLGATALKGLTGENLKVTRERGKWRLWFNRMLMPTYHPSALLRNPSLKRDAWEDFKKVILKYREIIDQNHPCQYI